MGEISYSVYLLGFTIMNGLRGTYVSTAPTLMAHINSVIKMGAIITLTTVFAYGGYNLIEKPARRFLRRVLSVKQEQPLLDTAKV